ALVPHLVALVETAWLYAQRRFLWPEVAALAGQGVGLALLVPGLLAGDTTLAAWAFVVKSGVHAGLLLPGLWCETHGPCWPAWHHPKLHEGLTRLLPLLAGLAVTRFDQVLDRVLLSFTAPGTLSLFHAALLGHGAANQVAYKALTVPLLSRLATLAGEPAGFQRILRQGLRHTLWLSLAAFLATLAVVWVLGGLWRSWVGVSPASPAMSLLAVLFLSLSGVWFAGMLGQTLTAGFYALGDTRTPMKIGLMGFFGVGWVLKIAGLALGGGLGIALAVSVYYSLNALWLYRELRVRLVPPPGAS
ncbi:MAG: lipid II flippase MurJ, partial [Pseudomonadota bacterium]